MTPITRKIFREEDNIILNYLNEDGENIEPEYYLPIIPMVLVNGVDGIGTGFMSKIPKYNPLDLIDIILKKLEDNSYQLLNFDFTNTETSIDVNIKPYYKGFKGEIINDEFGRYKIYGKF
jgi:DNA topoisomerase-2